MTYTQPTISTAFDELANQTLPLDWDELSEEEQDALDDAWRNGYFDRDRF